MKFDYWSLATINTGIRERKRRRIAGKDKCLQDFSSNLIFGAFSQVHPAFCLSICVLIKDMLQPKEAQVFMVICKRSAFFGKQVMSTCIEKHPSHNEELEKPMFDSLMPTTTS